jgi:predicted metal-dependent peptidase
MRLKGLKKGVEYMSAERIYKYFLLNPPSSVSEFKRLFARDDHVYWREQEKLEISEQEWKKINERIKAELKSFSRGRVGVESLIKNLEEAVKDRQDYGALLERFCARGEEMKVSEDEFDYIYYTYGLEHYDKMPLIEPLEFRDTKKIRDFVIVLDTSASCRGDIIRSFLAKTYAIIHNSESFFQKVNVHILQCDNEVQSDTRIAIQSDFDEFIKNGSFVGFGGTDFRPAFSYIDDLIEKEEFTDLKGVIYFTDGYGIYPEKAPEYDCIFAFLNEDEHRMEAPWWAIPVVLDEEQLA